MSSSIDGSQVRALARDLDRGADRALRVVEPVMRRAALSIKRDLQSEAKGSQRLRRVGASISYDVTTGPDAVEAEVGPELGRQQGSLGFVAYEGSPTSGPRFPDPMGALEREAEVFADYAARGLGDVL